jgi:coenzyme F420-0:L-glutamate ligase/coenzyme F420-1:gamma-L-glutamate ligase
LTQLTDSIQLIPITGIGEIRPGDNLAQSIIEAARRIGLNFEPHDIFIVAQKIVSKSEGRLVDLGTVEPTPRAIEIARLQERDPRLVEAILGESASAPPHRSARSDHRDSPRLHLCKCRCRSLKCRW